MAWLKCAKGTDALVLLPADRRLYTEAQVAVGGLAPADGCDQSAAGSERGVEYTAVYAFYHGSVAE